ncbi:rod shape-determining protein MreC [Pelosinus sp. IPA-1]|uniref:rod shape-determining protein MreC n=1 Tax=Pelosinus sp. IPA-1 TaxID=3029569 RepID=UPI0024361793|nr:rod shape-determining protein MreC [Pelosinus sp. IPA-1]GMB00624.1 cell shape-determining protein MreC [Pelosinus sp. IPA-1]
MRLFHKKTVILLVAVVIVFLLASSLAQGKVKFAFMEKIITTVLAPVEYVVSNVGFTFRTISLSTGELMTAYRDNKMLRAENDELRQNNLNVTEIAAENARLKAMLDYKKGVPQFDLVTAAVVGRDPGNWTSTIIINRGTADGVTKDMAVVAPQGLIGSVVTAYANVAKVQLVLDPRSAVGALVQRPESRVAAIVEGHSGTPLTPRMVNIARDADIVKGDKLITSGFGGIYPKGLLIGEVIDLVNEEGGLLKYAVLNPAVDFDRLEEVSVIVGSREPIPTLPPPPVAIPAPTAPGKAAAPSQGAGR